MNFEGLSGLALAAIFLGLGIAVPALLSTLPYLSFVFSNEEFYRSTKQDKKRYLSFKAPFFGTFPTQHFLFDVQAIKTMFNPSDKLDYRDSIELMHEQVSAPDLGDPPS
jgi:hypothetical protein